MPTKSGPDTSALNISRNIALRNYWRKRLSGFEPSVYFHDAGHNTEGANGRPDIYGQHHINTRAQVGAALEKLADSAKARHIALLAALSVLAKKYSGLEDICIFTPRSAQPDYPDPENDMVPIRIDDLRDFTFSGLLMHVKENVIQDIAHGDCPIEWIIDKKALESGAWPVTGMMVEDIHAQDTLDFLKPDLLFCFRLTPLSLTIRYTPLKFSPEYISRLSLLYFDLLGQLLENRSADIRQIKLIPPKEEHGLLFEFNSTYTTWAATGSVLSLFEQQAARTPERPALKTGDRTMSYKDLNEAAGKLASYLYDRVGIGVGDLVAVLLDRNEYLIITLLGVLKTGAAFVPIDPAYPPERIRAITGDSNVRVLITRGKYMNGPDTAIPEIVDLDAVWPVIDLLAFLAASPEVGGDSLAYVIYTSGSTGRPKGVAITHDSFFNYIAWAIQTYVKESQVTFPLFTSIAFDLTLTSLFVPLASGNAIYLYGDEGMDLPIERVLRDNQSDIVKLTPSHLTIVRDCGYFHSANNSSRIKKFIVGGEMLTTQLAREIYDLFGGNIELFNEYGPTEATVGCMIYKYDPAKDKGISVPIGRPIANARIYLLDRYLVPVPAEIPGEIYIAGTVLAAGYMNNKTLTDERFPDDPFAPGQVMYKTGDMAWRLPDDNLVFLGRKDGQAKIRGNRVELSEIESAILSFRGVEQAVVLIKHSPGPARLAAYVIAGANFTQEALVAFLRGKLPEYMVPGEIIPIDMVPLTVNGKIDNPALLRLEAKPAGKYAPPVSVLETTFVRHWERILETAPVGIDDNFFNIGGDSILSVRFLGAVNNELKVKITMADFLHNQTIRTLAALVTTSDRGEDMTGYRLVDHFMEQFALAYPGAEDESIEAVFPMSDIEKGICYVHLSRPDETLYLGQTVIPILHEDFNLDRLRTVMEHMMRKHPILRTAFDLKEYAHIVYKAPPFDIPFTDMSGWPAADQRRRIEEDMDKGKSLHFSQDIPPLWRMKIYRLAKDHHMMLFEAHHAILDGWSSASFITELNNIFVRLTADKEYLPEDLRAGYKDYIREELFRKRNMDKTAGFWKKELAGFKKLHLGGGDGKRRHVSIQKEYNAELASKIRAFAAGGNKIPRDLFFASYVYALKMLTYEDDLVVGFVSFNRPLKEDGDKVLGCFLNTLPVRIRIRQDITWAGYLAQVELALSDAVKHGTLSLFEINQALGGGEVGENPLFDTLFNFMDFHITGQIEPFSTAAGTGKEGMEFNNFIKGHTLFDVNMNINKQGVLARYDLVSGFMDENLFRRWLTYFERILMAIIERPDEMADPENILDNWESCKLIHGLNDTRAAFPGHLRLTDLFKNTCSEHPDRIAVTAAGQSITYAQLDERSSFVADHIRRKGAERNSIVGIAVERSLEMMIGILGILKANCAYLPIDPKNPVERNRFMLKDAGAVLILTGKKFSGIFVEIGEILDLEDPEVCGTAGADTAPDRTAGAKPPRPGGKEALTGDPTPDDPAYVIYTSGSTGRPKGVLVGHQAVVNRLHWMQKAYPIGASDTILQKTAYTFDVSVWELFWWLIAGAKLVMLEPECEKDPLAIIDCIERQEVTTIHFVPTMLNAFLESVQSHDPEAKRLRSLRYIFSSGEALTAHSANQFNQLLGRLHSVNLINLYGPTEATVDVTWFDCPSDGQPDIIPIGRPIDNIRLSILDKNGGLLPEGIAGELCIAGVGLARGYLNNPDLTHERFIWKDNERRYRTGDLARWLPDGNAEYLGRIDNQVKIRGHRIEPGEIENALMQVPGIREACVMMKASGSEAELVAWYTSEEEMKQTRLKTILREKLPEYMIPARLWRLPRMPVNVNGKLDRKSLPDSWPVGSPEDRHGERPETPKESESFTELEAAIAQLWKEVLGIQEIGREDIFYDLGGHSLSVIRLALKMKQLYGIEPSLRDFSHAPFTQFVQNYEALLDNPL
jgi:tyrocidine synthetase III